MTAEAIRNGFSQLRPDRELLGLAAAAECRAYTDWLIGMNATRALTKRLKSRREKTAWSAGRVQTPTLAILVDRELEILAHVPRPYWRVEARFGAADHEYGATWFDAAFRDTDDGDARDDRCFDFERANAIVEAVNVRPAGVTDRPARARETRRPSRETAPPLFDLTSLQREANRRFGWSARRALNAAQRCYEAHKLLTYPRTDSRALPGEYRAVVGEVLGTFAAGGPYQEAAAQLLAQPQLENVERTFDDSKISDHFAIIPTGRLPETPLSGDDARLFDLVVRRFLANFHPPAVWTRVERVTEVQGHSFRSRSRTLDEPGWRAVLGQTEQEDQLLPPRVPGETEVEGIAGRGLDVQLQQDATRPPARITEARLLSLMESAGKDLEDEELAEAIREKGIGTPATRADIIENLIAKGYVVRGGKSLRPTVKGIRLVDVLRRIKADRLASPALTGELEFQLNQVERGNRTAGEFMDEIVQYTVQIVDVAKTFDYEDLYPDEEMLGSCPLCGRPVFERSWFYRCLEVPGTDAETDCPFRVWKDKAGRYMDRQTVRTLLEKGETGELEGFIARDGRVYGGTLSLQGGEVVLNPVRGSASEHLTEVAEHEVDPEPLGPCPHPDCPHPGSVIVETPTQFRCRGAIERDEQNDAKARLWEAEHNPPGAKRRRHYRVPDEDRACPFVLPRTVCKREITREEALAYLREGRTPLLEDFTSRLGRPFAAVLFRKENGRHGFEFPPRGGARAAAPDAAEAPAPDAQAAGSEAPAAKKAGRRTKAPKPGAAAAKPARTARKRVKRTRKAGGDPES
jgi:DNA topoisomerase-3